MSNENSIIIRSDISENIYDMDYFKELRKKLKKVLSKSRYEHTLGVEFTAASLAMRYEYNIAKARVAGLLHDCAKCTDDDVKLNECIKYGIEVTEIEKKCKFLLHSKLGAYYAKSIYNVYDESILSAITYHTTGKPDMNLLEKIIFVADYIEPGRYKAKRLKEIQKEAFIDIDKAIYMILEDTLIYLKESLTDIDETTYQTYLYYKERLQ